MSQAYFRRQKQQPIAAAEEPFYHLLHKTYGNQVFWQWPVIFTYTISLDKHQGPRGTTVDYFLAKERLPIFLDGPHHLKPRQEERDKKVDRMLVRKKHYNPPLRIPYNGRVPSKRKLDEWLRLVKMRVERNKVKEKKRRVRGIKI
jgi:very-short-patch-repair endonuclease